MVVVLLKILDASCKEGYVVRYRNLDQVSLVWTQVSDKLQGSFLSPSMLAVYATVKLLAFQIFLYLFVFSLPKWDSCVFCTCSGP